MASTYLSRTLSTPTDAKKFTISVWVKGSDLGTSSLQAGIFNTRNSSDPTYDNCQFGIYNNGFYSAWQNGGVVRNNKISNALLRDVNSFYHLVWSVDTTQATASDRNKYYINGEQITSWSTDTDFDLNRSCMSSGLTLNVGRMVYTDNTSKYWNGSMSHFHFIDGTAYDADTFGETDSLTGTWKPKTAPSVSYGTNGFFLKFENSGSMGTDSSGNGNNFTVNGNLTQTVDTPSNVFATWNPLNPNISYPAVFAYGNTDVDSQNIAGFFSGSSTLGASQGKWYMEIKIKSNGTNLVGISYNPSELARNNYYVGQVSYSWGYYEVNGNYYNNNGGASYGDSYTTGDIIGIAMDLDNSKLYFSKNGVWQNSGDPTSGATGTGALSITSGETYFFCCGDGDHTSSAKSTANFGNGYFGTTAVSSATTDESGLGTFEYTVPTGYYALCTKNINEQEYS